MQKQLKKKILWGLLAAVAVIIVIAATAACWNILQKNEKQGGIVISEEAEDWNGNPTDLSEGQSGIKIPGYGEISVASGTKDWKIVLANPEENNCYFQYSITIDESETPIYESDLIEPGKAIKEFAVTSGLDAGDYEIHLNISTYSMDGEMTPLNGADVKADLHVV